MRGKTLTTTSHLSEISNILESRTTLKEALAITSSIVESTSIEVARVDVDRIRSAIYIAERYLIGVNDGLAINAMRENQLSEIYSRDKKFDNLSEIKRIWR